jgi:hypothetical protein
MGWETRGGKRYYYRKERRAGRVRSIYCGSGGRGERAAREDEARRACATPEVPNIRDVKKGIAINEDVANISHVKKASASTMMF